MNKNWPRWIYASMFKHLSTELSDFTIFIEGEERKTNREAQFIEIRMDGPYTYQLSPTFFRLYFEVNLLLQSTMKASDIYTMQRMIGAATYALLKPIIVSKYGIGDEDNESVLGCLNLVRKNRERDGVQTSNFGQVDKNNHLYQATVEAHYEIFLGDD